jgi:Bacterial Ig-like domain (group 2)
MPVPTFVQSTSSAPANTTSIVLTLNGVVTGNDVLVCVDATSGFDAYTVSDGVNSYVSALGPITSPPNNQFGQWFISKNVTGGNLTITVTTSISTTHFAAAVEVSGVDPITPIQTTDFAGAQNTSNALGYVTATSQPNTLAVAMTTAFGLGGVPVSQTLDGAWTTRENIAFAAGTPKGSGAVGSQFVAISGNTVQANSTLSRTASWLALTLLLNPVAAPTLVSISVTPINAALMPSGTLQYQAIGHFSDSSTSDITSTSTWASSNTGAATINSSTGLATTVAVGTTFITATKSSIVSNSAELDVVLSHISRIFVPETGRTTFTDTSISAIPDGVTSQACRVFSISADNSLNGSAVFIKAYNVGQPVVGTTAPQIVLRVPANAIVSQEFPGGFVFSTALSLASVTTGGVSGTSTAAANVVCSVTFK